MSSKHTKYLAWDSEFFGRKMASVALPSDAATAEADLERAVNESIGNGIECLTLVLDSADQPAVFEAARLGFALVDVRITLKAELKVTSTAYPVVVRPSRPSDRATVEKLALTSFSTTRFAVDPHFPKARVSEMYRVWVSKNLEGPSKLTLVATDKDAVAGFISCGVTSPDVANIELLAVGAGMRGKGVGSALVQGMMKHYAAEGKREVHVVTQARNIKGMTFYESAGFKVGRVELSFHKWFENKSRAAA